MLTYARMLFLNCVSLLTASLQGTAEVDELLLKRERVKTLQDADWQLLHVIVTVLETSGYSKILQTTNF